MIAALFLSVTLAAYKLVNDTGVLPCIEPKILVNGSTEISDKTYNTNETIWFRTPIAPGIKAIWNFGDSSKIEEGFSAKHFFTKPAIYNVTVTVNKNCTARAKIHIKNPAEIFKDSSGNITEHIIGADEGMAGEYKFNTPHNADSYKWIVEGNSNFVPRTTKESSFKFRNAGTYIIKLILDNDPQKTYRKEITVTDPSLSINDDNKIKPKKLIDDYPVYIPPKKDTAKDAGKTENTVVAPPVTPPPPPEKKKPMATSEQAFLGYLQAYVCGRMDYTKLYKYFCSDGKPPNVLRDRKFISFEAFCNEIGGQKIEIKSVSFQKNGDCIYQINVEYDKKSWYKKDPCKEQ